MPPRRTVASLSAEVDALKARPVFPYDACEFAIKLLAIVAAVYGLHSTLGHETFIALALWISDTWTGLWTAIFYLIIFSLFWVYTKDQILGVIEWLKRI